MSEEKLYAVKTGEGEFLSFSDDGDSVWNKAIGHFEMDKQKARSWAYNRGGHVVTLIEEPKKVVLTKEQAEIVDDAHAEIWPATYISGLTDSSEQRLMINAYVNGYTVEKEKKYLVYKVLGGKQKNRHEQVAQAYRSNLFFDTIIWLIKEHKIMSSDASDQFTEAEIEHYGLQDCEKEEVNDDEV